MTGEDREKLAALPRPAAKLIECERILENAHNLPAFIECRGVDAITFRVLKRYDEQEHSVVAYGGRVAWDIDRYGITWRIWDNLPTAEERKKAKWQPMTQ